MIIFISMSSRLMPSSCLHQSKRGRMGRWPAHTAGCFGLIDWQVGGSSLLQMGGGSLLQAEGSSLLQVAPQHSQPASSAHHNLR